MRSVSALCDRPRSCSFVRSTRNRPLEYLENHLTQNHQILHGHLCRPSLQPDRMCLTLSYYIPNNCWNGQSLPIHQLLRRQERPAIAELCAVCLPFVLERFGFFYIKCNAMSKSLQISPVKNIGSVFDSSGVAFRLARP